MVHPSRPDESNKDKIGRDDAERDYYEKLVPAVEVRARNPFSDTAPPHPTAPHSQSRPDLFPEDKLDRYFSVERYHLNGSRILSRSFHVEKWKGEHTEGDSDEEGAGGAEDESAMDVDPQEGSAVAHVDEPVQEDAPGSDAEEPQLVVEAEEDDSDDEDREDPADVAMVPMADMLNARFESENVCDLFLPCVITELS